MSVDKEIADKIVNEWGCCGERERELARGVVGGERSTRRLSEGRTGMSEKRVMQKVMKALSDAGSRLFRNHVAGVAWQGSATHIKRDGEHYLQRGDVVIRNARAVKAGLCKGSSDLVGWTTRMITEHDLGKLIAQFTACEVKTEDGELQPEQRQFLDVVRDSGGVAIVARSAEQAVSKLRGE